MAKKAAASAGDDLGDLLISMFGKNETTADDAGFISTRFLPLNHALSNRYYDGGIPRARITEIFGPPSAGKTSLFTDLCISVQEQGGFAALCDHERSFDGRLGESRGLIRDPSQWFYRKPRTFQESIGIFGQVAVAIRKSGKIGKAPILWGFDSLASMVPQAIIDKITAGAEMNMKDNAELARATSAYFPALTTICEELDVTVVFLNQMRMKLGVMFGDPTTSPGGESPKFYATCRIQLGATRLMKGKEEDKEQIGSEVRARIVKNKAARPYRQAKWIFIFREDGTGYFDAVGSMVDLLISKGLLPAGSKQGYYMLNGLNRTRDQMVKILTDDPGGKEWLEKLLVSGGVVAEDLSPEEIKEIKEAESKLEEKALEAPIEDVAAE